MELSHKEIPVQFLNTLPEGIKLVKREGYPFLVLERIHDHQGKSLISNMVQIHGEPSIKLWVHIGPTKGFLFLDAFWGSLAKLYSFIPDLSSKETFVEAFSPDSGASLMSDYHCNQEGCTSERSILLYLPGTNNKVYLCAKHGCPGHYLDINEMPEILTDSVSRINFFGAGEGEFFHGI